MTRCWAAVLAMITLSGCASAASHADTRGTAFVLGTITQSEWCPAGDVRVDLQTGKYALTAGAPRDVCRNPDLERPVVKGSLNASRLRALRLAFGDAARQGLSRCPQGRPRPEDIIVSNGGLHVLVVTDGRHTDAAPNDLSCWTDAAWTLHNRLADTFPSR